MLKCKIFLIFLLIIGLLIHPIYPQNLIRIVIDRDYPPFTYIDDNGNLVGISVEFWKIWSEKTGIKVELIPERWNVAQNKLLEGEVDAIDTIFKTPERERLFTFSKPIFQINSRIYYKSNLPKINSLKDLTPYIVGVKRGDAAIEIALNENPYINFRYYDNYSDIVKSAHKDEINVFLMDDIPANYYLIKNDLVYKFTEGPIFTTNYLYVASLKNKSHIINLINDGLSKIPKEEIEKLKEKYLIRVPREPSLIEKYLFYFLLAVSGTLIIILLYNRTLSRQIGKIRRELEQSTEKFWHFFMGISEISNLNIKEYDFLSKVLEIVLTLIPKAVYGSIFIKEGDNLRLISTKGHGKKLEGLLFEKGDYIESKDTLVMEKILELERKNKDLELELIKYSKPIKESLIVPLKWRENIWGYFCLDIPKGSSEKFNKEDIDLIEKFSETISIFYGIRNYIRERELYLNKLISLLIKTLEYYDRYTQGHSERVAKYAVKIAEKIGLDSYTIRKIYWAALLHDIGKIYIPQVLLNKNGRFTSEEYNFVKLHPLKSFEILSQVEELKDLAEIVKYHHERWDGKGYPDGISGEKIPLESRILAMADAFEAMTSERPYKRALNLEEAIEEIKRNKGTQFDPKLAEVMIELIQEESEKKS